MADEKRITMTKPHGSGTPAVANVLPDHVAKWEKQGWKKATAKAGDAADAQKKGGK